MDFSHLSLMRQFSWHSNSGGYLAGATSFVPGNFEAVSLSYHIQPIIPVTRQPSPPPRPATPPPQVFGNRFNFGPPPPYSPPGSPGDLRSESSESTDSNYLMRQLITPPLSPIRIFRSV